MIIDQASYDSYKSMDHNLIVNILETSVSVYDVSAPTPRQIDRVRFKNPSVACFSPSNQLLGVRDTSGRILVYDLKKQEIIVKQKQVKAEEGSDLYFLDENTLFFSDWAGKVYIFSIFPPTLKTIYDFKDRHMNVSSLVKTQDNQWILFGYVGDGYNDSIKTEIYLLNLDNGTLKKELLQRFSQDIYTLSYSEDSNHNIYFTAEEEDKIYFFNIENKSIKIFTTLDLEEDFGSAIRLVLSPFSPHLAVVFDPEVRIYHLKTKKVFFTFKGKSLMNLQFLTNNRIWIGSESKIYILDLPV